MNPDTLIEHVSLDDLNDVMAIEDTCFGPDAFSRRQISYLITRSKGIFLVAKHNNQVAGYVSLVTNRRHNTGRIYSIAVFPQYRGNGIGEALLEKSVAYARDTTLKAIFLEVRTDNDAAISLYKKKGFTKRLLKPNYYKDGADAYSMVLNLQPYLQLFHQPKTTGKNVQNV
jgi:ribosomal-protein-alanine acetyltransferase